MESTFGAYQGFYDSATAGLQTANSAVLAVAGIALTLAVTALVIRKIRAGVNRG